MTGFDETLHNMTNEELKQRLEDMNWSYEHIDQEISKIFGGADNVPDVVRRKCD